MKRPLFEGSAAALITPFTPDGKRVDFAFYESLLDFQLKNGTDALVIAGTTGEAPTLTPDEKRELFSLAVRRCQNRCPVIAGTGSNNTEDAVRKSNAAEKEGVDGLLIVAPFYNKCTQDGLIKHFTYIADRVSAPIVVYNVPSRTGVRIRPETYAALAEHPRIAGIKEADPDVAAAAKTIALVGENCAVYSGNDDLTLPLMALGAKGVISVTANVAPAASHELCARAISNDIPAARTLQQKYLRLTELLFCEVNPIPVKAAVGALFRKRQSLRLPLTGLGTQHAKALYAEMRRLNLI